MSNPVDVAVVGDGIVGSVVALTAAREGYSPRLLGRGGKHVAGRDRLFTINASARKALARVGAWDRLRSATPVRAMRIFSPGGKTLAIDAMSVGLAQLCHTVLESELLEALDGLLEDASIMMEPLSKVHTLSVQGDQVTIDVDQANVEAKLIVGADGGQSRIAELAGLSCPRIDFGQTAITTVASFSIVDKIARQWFGKDGVLALLPGPGGRYGIVWSLETERARRVLELTEEELATALQDATAGTMGACAVVGEARGHQLRCHVRKSRGDRVVLVGDSAQSFHPLAGQGLCVALGGVADLFDTFGGGDPGRKSALARYERLRRIRVAVTAGTTASLASVVGGESLIGTALDISLAMPSAVAAMLLPRLANAR